MASPPELPARFTPLQLASKPLRVLVVVLGPLLWLIAILVVGFVLHRRLAIEFGLAATLIAFLISLPISVLARKLRLRDEREAAKS